MQNELALTTTTALRPSLALGHADVAMLLRALAAPRKPTTVTSATGRCS